LIRNRIIELREQVEVIRKSRRMPYWKLSYADFMLQRVEEYLLVDRTPEAVLMCDRLDSWVSKNKPSKQWHEEIHNPKIVFWSAPFLRKVIAELKTTLSQKKQLIPAPERDSFSRRLDKIESWIEEGKILKAREDLLAVRLSLIARLKRSYRARTLTFAPQSKNSSISRASSTVVGLYNSQHTLENTFSLIGERDPIWVDMSEYMEKHSVARLIGAPPGYVGYEEGGQLTEAVRTKPYSVVLLDEVEKAHPDVFNTLLQVLDDGRLTDGKGRVVSFKNTIVLMTSNLGSHLFQQEHQKVSLEQVMPELRRFFRPEFLNRLDETLVFTSLSRDQLHSIVKLKVNALQERLSKQGFLMSVTEEAIAAIAEKSYDPQFGARPIQRYLQRELERVLSHAIIAGEVKTETPFVVDYKEKAFVIQ
jgi:hypothetical protein